MNIALMSHDNKKELMVQFCTAYAGILSHHNIYATNTTGHMVADATGLNVHCFLSYAHGGSQQIGARIAYNEFDLVLFFNDPNNEAMVGDVSYISRLCDQNNIPFASNLATAEALVLGLALHRQSLQPSHRLTFFPKAHTITLLIHLHRADAAAVLQSPAPQRGAHR